MTKSVLVLALAFFTQSAVLAQSPVGIPEAAAKPAGEKLICKSIDVIGSRLQKGKRCMTAVQWRQMARDQSDDIDKRLRTVHEEAAGS